MTRAYWDKKRATKILLKLLCEEGERKDGKQIFDEWRKERDEPVMNTVSRMVRFHSDQMINFKALLSNSLRDCNLSLDLANILNGCPLMVPAKDTDKIRVFTNIPIDDWGSEGVTDAITNVSWPMFWTTVGTFMKTYNEDKTDKFRSKMWDGYTRIWRRIKRYEELTTARVLTRYTHLQKLGISDAIIRNLAASIDDQRRPLQLTFCQKPDDMIEMYATGPRSCMSGEHAVGKSWDKFLFPLGHHPASFFYYHPYITGVFSKIGNSVVARSFIYEYENGKKLFGRVYASNEKYREKFINTLREQSYEPIGDIKNVNPIFKRKCTFTIPALCSNGKMVMPLPYCDNLHNSVRVSFNEDKKEFNVFCSDDHPNITLQSQSGFIDHTVVQGKLCRHCQRLYNNDHQMLNTLDGHRYCGRRCLEASGYVMAYRSDGTLQGIRIENAIKDELLNNTYYTNMDAAVHMGALPILDSVYEDCEDEEKVSKSGHIISRNNEFYRFYMADVDRETEFNNAIRSKYLVQATTVHPRTREGYFIAQVGEEEKFKFIITKSQKVVEYDEPLGNELLFGA